VRAVPDAAACGTPLLRWSGGSGLEGAGLTIPGRSSLDACLMRCKARSGIKRGLARCLPLPIEPIL